MSTVKVSHILSVTLAPKPGDATSILIKAEGENGNSNMTNIRLDAVIYVKPPTNGIWEFFMSGDEPQIVDQLMTKVKAQAEWKVPQHAKGVKVTGAGNSVVAYIRRDEAQPVGQAAEIEILKAIAWVNAQPMQPKPMLHVEVDYNCADHGFHTLKAAVPPGINPADLLLEITQSPELIFFPNPRHSSYTQPLAKPGQYSSIEILYKGNRVGSIDKIPVVV